MENTSDDVMPLIFESLSEADTAALGAALDLYFSTFHHDFSLPRVRFLTLAQSLEAYHRATMPGKYMADEDYSRGLRQRLSAAIPENDPAISSDFGRAPRSTKESIEQGSTYRVAEETVAYHPLEFAVYGRGKGSCSRCHGALEEIRLGNRSTVFCPRCQV